MPTISLPDGTPVAVDEVDLEWAQSFSWSRSAATAQKAGYAMRGGVRSGTRWTRYMHREIAERAGLLLPNDGRCVDHIDRDHFNNRRSNLRAVDYSENNGNVEPRTPSGMLGVYFHPTGGWGAEVQRKGQRRRRYGFATADEAAAWREAALDELRCAA